MEVDIPFDVAPAPAPAADPTGPNTLASVGQTQFFCIPQNDTLLAYWDTVADRLFKIHNSLNIQGVFQKLPLFDPPIDPALLVRAAAEGLDVNAIVNGLNQPLPLVRFQLLVSKAAEICQEVKSLGGNLLSAFEKGDNEALSLLRAQHESIVLNLAETVKYSQWQDAIKTRQGLEVSLANAGQRYTYYQKLLRRTAAQITLPSMDPLDTSGLASLELLASRTPPASRRWRSTTSRSTSRRPPGLGGSDGGDQDPLSSHEAEELADLAASQGPDRAGRPPTSRSTRPRPAAELRGQPPCRWAAAPRSPSARPTLRRDDELHGERAGRAGPDRELRGEHGAGGSGPTPAASRNGPSRATSRSGR